MPDAPRACVLGLGLIGGSIAAALTRSKHYQQVIGWDIAPEVTRTAAASGYITQPAATIETAVADADLVILCMYVQGIIDTLQKIAPHLKTGALVIDTGSTKTNIIATMNTLPDGIDAIGGHPMAGKLTSGVDGVDANLYQNRIFALTPTQRTTPETIARAQAFVDDLGARSIIVDVKEHDRHVAMISHLMRILPLALIEMVNKVGNETTWELAAGSFRETTSPVQQNLGFWEDVFSTNKAAIIDAMRNLAKELEDLAETVEKGDIDTLITRNEQAKIAWQKRYDKDQNNTE